MASDNTDTHGTSDVSESAEGTVLGTDRPRHGGGDDRGFWARWSWAIICGWFSVIGAILLMASAGTLVGELRLRADCTEITDGIVTQMILNPADPDEEDSSDTWTPVFRYGVDGRSYEQRASVASSPPRYEVGQAVTVRYDPADPSRYVVEGDNAALILYTAITVMCLGFTAVLPVALAVRRRR
ncbi:DUF3592 domain-containing protein [Bifidobacterium simiarum]|nr:DUF3592 domain-containing protein [Bifidobacterium simiarum]MBT1166882.1 DUF3592 domain-containing protein [Bifidobacterium simiarum]